MTKVYSTKSWHYRLATFYGQMDENDIRTNTCDYYIHVGFGIVAVAIVIFLVSVISAIMLSPLWWLTFSLIYGWIYPFTSPQIVGTVFWTIALCTWLVIKYEDQFEDAVRKLSDDFSQYCSTNYATHIFRMIAAKICIPIEFKEHIEELKHQPQWISVHFYDGSCYSFQLPADTKLPNNILYTANHIRNYTTGEVISHYKEGTAKREQIEELLQQSEYVSWEEIKQIAFKLDDEDEDNV